jgi:hypothetical protein
MNPVLLHQKVRHSQLWKDVPSRLVFLEILLLANQKDRVFWGRTIPRGHLVIGLRTLARYSLVTYQQLRTVLTKFVELGMITTEIIGSGRGRGSSTHITICNWERYQQTQRNSNAIGNANNQLDNNNIGQSSTQLATQISVSSRGLSEESTLEPLCENNGLFDASV